jgi:Fic-DOC domain mobile mystery protein B
MGIALEYGEGQTPLDDEEKEGLLIPAITTRAELDEFEQLNIEQAVEWTLRRKFDIEKMLSEEFVKELHKRMFNDVWKWAGKFRITNKNLGVDCSQISIELRKLLDDTKFWIANKTFPSDEIVIRFKHRLVSVHCFSNGNGRHSRLIADVVVSRLFAMPVYAWGSSPLIRADEARRNYLVALKAADRGNITPLIDFARTHLTPGKIDDGTEENK